MTDLTYLKSELFTTFSPESEEGYGAYNQLLEQNENSNKIFTRHLEPVLSQFKKAGYTVKAVKESKLTMEQIFKELEELEG